MFPGVFAAPMWTHLHSLISLSMRYRTSFTKGDMAVKQDMKATLETVEPLVSHGVQDRDAVVRLCQSWEQSLWQMYNTIMKLKWMFNQEGRQPPHTCTITAKFLIESVPIHYYSSFLLTSCLFSSLFLLSRPNCFNLFPKSWQTVEIQEIHPDSSLPILCMLSWLSLCSSTSPLCVNAVVFFVCLLTRSLWWRVGGVAHGLLINPPHICFTIYILSS